MAINLYNSAEGGINGVTVSTSNSGGNSGSAFSVVTPGTGGTITFSNGFANSGNYSNKLTAGAASACFIGYNYSTTSTLVTGRAYVYLTGWPSVATQLMTFLNSGLVANIALASTGRFITQVTSSGTIDTSPIGTTLPLNTWVRLELRVRTGTNATNGGVSMSAYTGDSTTSLIYTFSNEACDTDTTPPNFYRVGKTSNAGNWSTMYIDDVQLLDDTSNIGPVSTLPSAWLG